MERIKQLLHLAGEVLHPRFTLLILALSFLWMILLTSTTLMNLRELNRRGVWILNTNDLVKDLYTANIELHREVNALRTVFQQEYSEPPVEDSP